MAEMTLVSANFGQAEMIVRTINGEMQIIASQGPGMEVQMGITPENADDALALFTAGINAVKMEKSIDELQLAHGTLGVWEATDSGYGNFTCLYGSGHNGVERFSEGETFEVHESELVAYEGAMPKKEKAAGKAKRGSFDPEGMAVAGIQE